MDKWAAHGVMRDMAAQCGIAVVTVLFILVLLTTLSVYLVEQEHLLLRRAGNLRAHEQAHHLAVGSEYWAGKVLERDAEDNQVDHLGEAWNKLEGAVPVEQGQLSTGVIDLQSRFNLNNLAAGRESPWYRAFLRLLELLSIEQAVAHGLVDWLDADQQATGAGGAEDYEYGDRKPPYRSADRLLSTVGELRWIRGFDSEVIKRLEPFVTALPEQDVPINVNTCLPLLFQILAPNPTMINESMAQTLAIDRGEEGYEDINAFLSHDYMAGEPQQIAQPLISVNSNFFEVHSRARFGKVQLWLISGMYRAPERPVVTIYRKRGLVSPIPEPPATPEASESSES